MGSWIQDIRFGARQIFKNPGFAAVVLSTLALAIGANTAIFSVVQAVLLESLPFPEPQRLLFLTEASSQFPDGMSVAYPNFLDWRERQRVFDFMAAHRNQSYNVTGLEKPVQVRAVHTSAALFPMLGVKALHGHLFREREDQIGSPRVLVVGHRFWRQHLGGDPAVVGQNLLLDGEPWQILGVLPAGFGYPFSSVPNDLWMPLGHFADRDYMQQRGSHPGIQVTARLAPGVTVERARGDLATLAAALAAEYPDSNTGSGVLVTPLQERLTRNVRQILWVLSGAVLLVLLIACLNIANLLLARATGRSGEIAVRSALGAGRGRLLRQLLTESVLLSLLGGLAGLALARLGIHLLVGSLDPRVLPPYSEITLEGPVLAFTFLTALATGVLFGLAPAWLTTREAMGPLRDGGRGGAQRGSHRLRGALVVGEVALALVLLIGAVLFVQSFRQLTAADLGVETRNVLSMSLTLPREQYPEPGQITRFLDRVVEAVQGLPGVTAAAHTLPLFGGWQSNITVEGQPIPEPGEGLSTEILRVSPTYFETLGMRRLRGRFFEPQDRADGPSVAVIDETFAETLWPGEDPIGKRFLYGTPDPESEDPVAWIEVVGVTNHIKSYGVQRTSRIQSYIPAQQNEYPLTTLLVKTAGEPRTLVRSVESAILALDPNQPVANIMTLEELAGRSILPQKMLASLGAAFAGLALVLAALGIYSVMAYAVSQRRQEIGVRMALGADGPRVLGLVIGQGMRLALLGIGVGLGLSLGLIALGNSAFLGEALQLDHLLFQVNPWDLGTLVVLPIFLASIAFAATFFPARRATRVDPVVALRSE
jgi:putative ABC transport system permease protein